MFVISQSSFKLGARSCATVVVTWSRAIPRRGWGHSPTNSDKDAIDEAKAQPTASAEDGKSLDGSWYAIITS